jgi:ABC-2 type transport system permease protein
MYILKEWKEESRGVGIWIALAVSCTASMFILVQSRSFPPEQGFEAMLLSLYEMNLYLIPLLSLFISSLSIISEKEQKTLMIFLTKKESYRGFLLRKSIAVQTVLIGIFTVWNFVLALPMKFIQPFHLKSFLAYLIATIVLLFIFNQIGLLLGSFCNTRLQLTGTVIFSWFAFLYLLDLVFLYMLPTETKNTIQLFSAFYFLDPLHTIYFYLENALGLLSLNHLSKIVEQMVWMSPNYYLLTILLIWTVIPFELAVWFYRKGATE